MDKKRACCISVISLFSLQRPTNNHFYKGLLIRITYERCYIYYAHYCCCCCWTGLCELTLLDDWSTACQCAILDDWTSHLINTLNHCYRELIKIMRLDYSAVSLLVAVTATAYGELVDSQAAANMVALCTTDHKILPLSVANLHRPQVNDLERELVACVWGADRACAQQALDALRSEPLINDRNYGNTMLQEYQAQIDHLSHDKSVTIDRKKGRAVMEALRSGNYESALQLAATSKGHAKKLQIIAYLYQYPSAVYSPTTQHILLTGDDDRDLLLLEAVHKLANTPMEELLDHARAMKRVDDKDPFAIRTEMYLHQAAGAIRAAAKYAKMYIKLVGNDADAISLQAAAYLCGEMNSNGIEKHEKASDLYKKFKEEFGAGLAFIDVGMSLAQKHIGWDDAVETCSINSEAGRGQAPQVAMATTFPYRETENPTIVVPPPPPPPVFVSVKDKQQMPSMGSNIITEDLVERDKLQNVEEIVKFPISRNAALLDDIKRGTKLHHVEKNVKRPIRDDILESALYKNIVGLGLDKRESDSNLDSDGDNDDWATIDLDESPSVYTPKLQTGIPASTIYRQNIPPDVIPADAPKPEHNVSRVNIPPPTSRRYENAVRQTPPPAAVDEPTAPFDIRLRPSTTTKSFQPQPTRASKEDEQSVRLPIKDRIKFFQNF